MLKSDFHIHINLDPEDTINYNYKTLIDRAKNNNYQVLAITCHDKVVVNQEMKEYAKSKNILLISGVEITLKNRHILVYNITEQQRKRIKTFKDLIRIKENNPDIFVIAPHPYHFDFSCLRNKIKKYFYLFDAWEFSFFYSKLFPLNRKIIRLSKKYDKPLVGNGDVHKLKFFNRTYTLIDAKKNEADIFRAIKDKKVVVVSKPLKEAEFFYMIFWVLSSPIRKIFKKIKNLFFLL